MVCFLAIGWFYLSAFLLPLFGIVCSYIFRLTRKFSSMNYSSSSLELSYETDINVSSNYVKEDSNIDLLEHDRLFEDRKSELCLRFKFPTYEEFSRSKHVSRNLISFENKPSSSSSKYEFTPAKSISTLVEEMEPKRFKVGRVNAGISSFSFGSGKVKEHEFLLDSVISSRYVEADSDYKEIQKDSIDNFNVECVIKDLNDGLRVEHVIKENEALEDTIDEGKSINEEDNFDAWDRKEESLSMDNGFPEAFSLKDVHSIRIRLDNDGFLSDGGFGGTFVLDNMVDLDEHREESDKKMTGSDEESQESENLGEEDSDLVEELRILEEESAQTSQKLKYNFLSEKHFGEQPAHKFGKSRGKEDYVKGSDKFTIPELKNDSVMDSDQDTNKLETLWEHQDLIEQLKMELRKVRATGLPTILEESESPKLMEDLKPWKFDDKFHNDHPMGELLKFYKSFRERMRKFDILNYQKMYAIGFLQLKDPHQSIPMEKTSAADITSMLWQNLYVDKSQKHETDPTMKFIKELQSDLELVYVGQMCLSWEILHWQYEMALDLWESDPRGICHYNEVAGEFQQFQVLIQRFLEDESIQGSRVQNYVKQRCVLRNLLQVPIIREDISKDNKKERMIKRDEYSITIEMLVEIVEESIRIYWRFIHADKNCSSALLKSRKGQIELQDPADSQTLKEVQKDFKKKDRMLKDQIRSGNCILKKLKKCREDDTDDQVLIFFCQVDMKLVWRVLNMQRLTADQLAWCRNKLNTISFVNRKIHVEPNSFCLFPC
ncbi:Ribosomal protein L34Ae [Heracleum sosnowskyi]|uniref:Ribosomal protein L34Ae n=1 Tax=Heracleum sosnowskyi TaxID=360622 RepID=A0AAD8MSF1_9APIA|nr:Ribosomal protein L34Ae [Heracleum sosnowskyi]